MQLLMWADRRVAPCRGQDAPVAAVPLSRKSSARGSARVRRLGQPGRIITRKCPRSMTRASPGSPGGVFWRPQVTSVILPGLRCHGRTVQAHAEQGASEKAGQRILNAPAYHPACSSARFRCTHSYDDLSRFQLKVQFLKILEEG